MYRLIPRAAALLAAAILALALGRMPALAAATYSVIAGTLTTSSSTAGLLPGSSITIGGRGYAPGARVVITAQSPETVLGTTTADATGSISGNVKLSLDPGAHTITATGVAASGGTRVLSLTVVILGVAGLAASDANVGGLAVSGAAALAAGVGLILVARRLGRSPSPE